MLSESEGIDNYLGELAAQIDVLNLVSEVDRVAIIFDATSPVKCMQRFRRLCARARQCIHVGRWIEVMSRLVNRVESVVFIWQTSHVGEPVNEWADALASHALWEPRLPIIRMPCDFASMTFPKRWRGDWYDQGSRSWAVLLLRKFVNARLGAASSGHGEFETELHFPVVRLQEETEATRKATLYQRRQMSDHKLYLGKWRRAVLGSGQCPFGCRDSFTWDHVHFRCMHKPLAAA